MADAYDKAAMTGKLDTEVSITVPANSVGEVLVEKRNLEAAKEDNDKDAALSAWEARFADYLAHGLGRIKATHARRADPHLRNIAWKHICVILSISPRTISGESKSTTS